MQAPVGAGHAGSFRRRWCGAVLAVPWQREGPSRGAQLCAAMSAQPLSAAEVPSYCRMQSVACAMAMVVTTRLLNSELPLECVYFGPTALFIQ